MTKTDYIPQTPQKINRQQIFNDALKSLINLYGGPLKKAVRRLHTTHNESIDLIVTEVFDDTLSRQAVYQNYIKKGEK